LVSFGVMSPQGVEMVGRVYPWGSMRCSGERSCDTGGEEPQEGIGAHLQALKLESVFREDLVGFFLFFFVSSAHPGHTH